MAPSELDHFRKLEKLIWPCAGQLALHPLPIHVILHSGTTHLLYDSTETGFLAPYLSAFCHLFGGDWYAGRIMVLLPGAASKSSKLSELSNMYWAARNKKSNLTEFRIGRCWNLAIMFVCLHSLQIFIQRATSGHAILSLLIPELTSSVDKNSSFLVPIFIVWTRTLAFTLSREVISWAVHNRVNTAIATKFYGLQTTDMSTQKRQT